MRQVIDLKMILRLKLLQNCYIRVLFVVFCTCINNTLVIGRLSNILFNNEELFENQDMYSIQKPYTFQFTYSIKY